MPNKKLDCLTLLRVKDELIDDFVQIETKPVDQRSIPTQKTLEEWRDMFEEMVAEDPLKPQPLVVFEIIQKSFELDNSTTTQELVGRIRYVRKALTSAPSAGVCVESAGEIFTRLITRYATDIENVNAFADVRKMFIERGADLIKTSYDSPNTISTFTKPIFLGFYLDHINHHYVCVDGWDPVIFQILKDGYKTSPNFTVHVMESLPLRHGVKMVQELDKAGIPCKLFSDSILAIAVSKCSAVFCNVEGITPDAEFYVTYNTVSLFRMAERFRIRVHCTCQFFKMMDTIEGVNKNLPTDDDNIGCYDIPKEEWKPRMELKPSNKRKTPAVRALPASSLKTLYTDVGPLTSSTVYENFIQIFT